MKRVLKIVGISFGMLIIIAIIRISYFTGISVFNNSMQMSDNESTSIENAKSYFKKINFDLENFKTNYKIENISIKSTLDGQIIL